MVTVRPATGHFQPDIQFSGCFDPKSFHNVGYSVKVYGVRFKVFEDGIRRRAQGSGSFEITFPLCLLLIIQ